jgi:hypothetical protein
MAVLGRASWWLPGRLDRIVPHLDVEGPDVEGDDVEGLDVEGRDIEGRDVEGRDIVGRDIENHETVAAQGSLPMAPVGGPGSRS